MGIFRAAARVEMRSHLTVWSRELLRSSLDWFNDNLPVPRLDDPDWRALFWFRPQSDVVREMWQLVAILREEEVAVGLRYTKMPGRIVYQDEFQIAAIPYTCGRRQRKQRLPQLV